MPSADAGRETRAHILRTAMDTASVKGLSGLSIGDLAARLGMSKSGLFRHFGAKEQLQLATTDAALDVFEQQVVTHAMAASPGVDRLRALMHQWVGYLESDVFPGGCFFAAASATGAPASGAPRLTRSQRKPKPRNTFISSAPTLTPGSSRSSCTPTRSRPTGPDC